MPGNSERASISFRKADARAKGMRVDGMKNRFSTDAVPKPKENVLKIKVKKEIFLAGLNLLVKRAKVGERVSYRDIRMVKKEGDTALTMIERYKSIMGLDRIEFKK
jgi:hypothetical protein